MPQNATNVRKSSKSVRRLGSACIGRESLQTLLLGEGIWIRRDEKDRKKRESSSSS